MAKKVFKGFVGKSFNLKKSKILDLFWEVDELSSLKKSLWTPEKWPPRRVTVTVEVED